MRKKVLKCLQRETEERGKGKERKPAEFSVWICEKVDACALRRKRNRRYCHRDGAEA